VGTLSQFGKGKFIHFTFTDSETVKEYDDDLNKAGKLQRGESDGS
jgi:hypothetical protein